MHRLLFVDDERNILNSLSRVFEDEPYEIITASSANEGLNIVSSECSKIALVMSDFKMPEVNGIEFLQKIKNISPKSIRIMLTGFADVDAMVCAINNGEVYRFIMKPWNDEDIKVTIRNAVSHYDLINQVEYLHQLTQDQNAELKELNKQLENKVFERTKEIHEKNKKLETLNESLEKNFVGSIHMFLSLIELKDPINKAHSQRVAFLAKNFAQSCNLDPEEIKNIEVASLLHDIGKICLPDMVTIKPYNQLTLNELCKFKEHPVIGETVLSGVDNLTQIGKIIRHHHERFDGKGFPDSLSNNDIPLCSRIIAVINTYDNLINPDFNSKKETPKSALNFLNNNINSLFDPKIVAAFDSFMTARLKREQELIEIQIQPSQLREGMILSRDIYTANGLFLIQKGETIKKAYIEKIINYSKLYPIKDGIFIFHKKKES